MYVGEEYPVYYVSKNKVSGLTNILLLVRKPDKSLQGFFSMYEFDHINYPGRYLYEYIPDIEGKYLFSVFEGGVNQSSKSEFFSRREDNLIPVAEF